MKWFKHYTDALDDPFIQELLAKFGPAGYLAYFGLIEIIAKENGNMITGKLEISPTYLKQKLHISKRKLEEIFDFCRGKGKVIFDKTQVMWKFEMAKLLILKDSHVKASPESPPRLRDKSKSKSKNKKESKRKPAPVPKILKHQFGEFKNVLLTTHEHEQLQTNHPTEIAAQIENLSGYIESKNVKYKSHYATLQNWIRRDSQKKQTSKKKAGNQDFIDSLGIGEPLRVEAITTKRIGGG